MTLECRVSGFVNQTYGKYSDDAFDSFIIMEYDQFLAHIADSELLPGLEDNSDFKRWLR